MIRPQDSLAMIMNPKQPEQRLLAVVLALVSVVGLAYASVSRRWMYNPATVDGEYGFGPMGMFHTVTHVLADGPTSVTERMTNGELIAQWQREDESEDQTLKTLVATGAPAGDINVQEARVKRFHDEHHTSAAFPIVGWLAFIGCVLAGLSIAIAIALVALKKRPHLPIMPTTTAILGIMLALVTGCLFVATKPGDSGFIGVSFGFWGYGVGCILGIASTLMLNRSLRPVDDDLAEPMNAEQF
jgi:drug/metabolite transporter (DMT)-like permease